MPDLAHVRRCRFVTPRGEHAVCAHLARHAALGVILLAAAHASPAVALTPAEAASMANQLGRPLPSRVQVGRVDADMQAEGAEPKLVFAPRSAPLLVYLNRFGGTYRCGNDDSSRNLSSVVCEGGGQGTVGGFSGSAAQWDFVRTCVADLFAPFNLHVTDLEPTEGDYVEAVVGGSPDEAGMPWGVGGVAPFSCGLIPKAVVYAFADVYGNDMQGVCETVAQEVAHAFGLDHAFLCQDPMTYLGGCGAKAFQDTWAQCGEFEPRECSCGGTSQNSVQAMLTLLGASDGSPPPPPPVDRAGPSVALVSPEPGAILPANATVQVVADAADDVGLTTVELEWDFTGDAMYCPATLEQTGSYACSRAGTRFTWQIRVGEGNRTFRVRVRDVAGNMATSATRSIWLSTDGSGPPDDAGPPSVFVATPAEGAVLPANAVIEVVATLADDAGLARGELLWTNNGSESAFPCPMDSESVICAVNGSTYTWSLRVGEGRRRFFVRATDVVGKVAESAARTITLRADASPPDDNDDDTQDRASLVACGAALTGEASDADWYVLQAPAGQRVIVALEGEALGRVSLLATTGPLDRDVVAGGQDDLGFTSVGVPVAVVVIPERADAGSYNLTVTCEAPSTGRDAERARQGDQGDDGADSIGCSQGLSAGPWGLTALLLPRLLRQVKRRGRLRDRRAIGG